MMSKSIRVYVENKVGRDRTYEITRDVWDAELGHLNDDIEVTIRTDSEPDFKALEEAHVFVGSGFDVRRIRQHGRKLRLVHSTSAGVDRYFPLTDWLPAAAVLTNSSGIHASKAAEYATMAILALSVGVPRYCDAQRQKLWSPQLTPTARGKNVVLVGLGSLGTAVADALERLGLKTFAVTRHGSVSGSGRRSASIAELGGLLPLADFLVLCCPLTPETRGMIGAEQLSMMPEGASVINMARGPVLQSDALVGALESGHLAGAFLDVFDEEPLPTDDPLWTAPRAILTPHISCDCPEGYASSALGKLEPNLRALLQGQMPSLNVVSPTLGY